MTILKGLLAKREQTDGAERGVLEALRESTGVAHIRWSRILVWFMRLMAVVWMVLGLTTWADILGILPAAAPFEDRTFGAQATLVYFAVLNLVAAVGLWLTSTWGGIMWLLAVMSQLILAIFVPRAVASGSFTIVMFSLLIAIYLTISWLAAHDQE
ncbi:DUF6163 family protein [Chelatococcus reniformis]|uniref:Uncharacterized protein n=1 Tax=Chelatococcus reniformis TaxID=1494448 RepID=A0A916UIE2_9HYPH|nr:DUF6163 family protein [Chelatococcus reniformis]GGC74064.1 hypothetical protein GCM10010994_35540 [Chelatococcus reniformis]